MNNSVQIESTAQGPVSRYPFTFKEEVKGAFPNNPEMWEALETGSDRVSVLLSEELKKAEVVDNKSSRFAQLNRLMNWCDSIRPLENNG
ncbi:MAG: hypothetical protein R3B38_02805 [Patescibacteria group bacterium]